MWPTLKILLILGGLTTLTEAFNYMFIMDDDGLMAPCEDQPGNHINFMDGLFDMSTSKLGKFDGKLRMEGDLIVKWTDVQPEDTLTFVGQIYKWEHNAWQKTMFSASSKNFCRNMFEKGQYWYDFWTKHITNADEIMNQCLNTPGAVLKHELFEPILKGSLNVPNLEGRYKLVITVDAFDKKNVKRPVTACTEFRGIVKKS
ncbi:uncharacterized protein Dana_GF13150 [Drosophila ananassae]|uniref:Uncharacterized protein n=1 Tax=Drosophila ananassae TaxID=7217 RepID=B3MGR4_DROAN|nr:uncharacterized protein LOC6495993 [Drosophila ananassae]EDV36822.1 uncharacterized protein Dana_GF13150 [Drosophila ananassae]